MSKKITLLGSTGSIGKRTLEVVSHFPDQFEIVALGAKSNIDLLEVQAKKYRPQKVAVYDKEKALELQKRLDIEVLGGIEGLKEIAAMQEANFAMLAMTGSVGLIPATEAICSGKTIGLANKEVLVSGGEYIMDLVQKHGVTMIPVDSELNAIYQCIGGAESKEIGRLILTASGGPFRDFPKEKLEKVSLADALNHPNYKMGPKVTIDSSTLMNKGLEMIEAKWLFNVPAERIEAVVHPEQRVHSLVEFIDGSMIAQLSEPDMLLPIQHALCYPKREKGPLAPYDFTKNPSLHFSVPDADRFRCFALAQQALKEGRSYPCFLNAANEALVEQFLEGKISWIEIGRRLDELISSHEGKNLLTLREILDVDRLAREKVGRL